MKLALDVWYEAWGRGGNGDASSSAKHGGAKRSAEAAVQDGARREWWDRRRWGGTGDLDPPPVARP